jgi:hypothetical protein
MSGTFRGRKQEIPFVDAIAAAGRSQGKSRGAANRLRFAKRERET